MRRESFIRQRIELPGSGIPLNGGIELFCVVRFEPGAKSRKITRGKLLDGLFDVFSRAHMEYIAFRPDP
jgi:hypothetical protein